jgi:hypothetical protein
VQFAGEHITRILVEDKSVVMHLQGTGEQRILILCDPFTLMTNPETIGDESFRGTRLIRSRDFPFGETFIENTNQKSFPPTKIHFKIPNCDIEIVHFLIFLGFNILRSNF